MMTMMATRMKMMATKQPIRIRVLLSSTLWVGSSSKEREQTGVIIDGDCMVCFHVYVGDQSVILH